MLKFLDKLWTKLVFWIGDIRRVNRFPWITWATPSHKISYDECLEALKLVRSGDVGFHMDLGYLSNFFLGGLMKHAFLFVDSPNKNDVTKMQVVEAISEGVVKRNAIHPLHSDYAIILRPKGIKRAEIKEAVKKANLIVGQRYDAKFKFDLEEETELFSSDDSKDLEYTKTNLENWNGGFSCTEVVCFCYFNVRKQLSIFRKRFRGKDVVKADDFINNNWKIVWCSSSLTLDVAKKYGLHEEGLEMLKDYLG